MKKIFLIIILLQVAPCTAAEQNTRYLGSNDFYSGYPQLPQVALLPFHQLLIYSEYAFHQLQTASMAAAPLATAALNLPQHHNSSNAVENNNQTIIPLIEPIDRTQQLIHSEYTSYHAQTTFMSSVPTIPVTPAVLPLLQHHSSSSLPAKKSSQITIPLTEPINDLEKKPKQRLRRRIIEICGEEWLKNNKMTEDELLEISCKNLNLLLKGQPREVIMSVKKAKRREERGRK